jgi:hypothetical protein
MMLVSSARIKVLVEQPLFSILEFIEDCSSFEGAVHGFERWTL